MDEANAPAAEPIPPTATPAPLDPIAEYRARVRALTGTDPVAPDPEGREVIDWVVWEFDQDQWNGFLRIEALRLLLLLGRNMLIGGIFTGGLILTGVVIWSYRVLLTPVGVLMGLLIVVALIGAYLLWRLLPLWRGPHQVRIRFDRVLTGARYTSLQEATQELYAVVLIPGRVVRIAFHTHTLNERYQKEQPSSGVDQRIRRQVLNWMSRRTIWVPVPHGREAEASMIVGRFASSSLIARS